MICKYKDSKLRVEPVFHVYLKKGYFVEGYVSEIEKF